MPGCKVPRSPTMLIVLALVVSVFLLVAAVSAEVTVRVQDYLLNEPEVAQATADIIKEFESKFPNIKVKLEKVGSNAEAVKNLKGKNPPDVARVETYYVTHLADDKVIQSLNKFIEKKGAIDYYWIPQFTEHAVIPCLFKKKDMYGVPQEGSPILVFVNKERCEKAGLDIDNSPPRNWEEFLTYAQKLTTADQGQYGFGSDFTDPTRAPQNLLAWLVSGNAELFDKKGEKSLLNSDEAGKALTFLINLHTKHKVMPPDMAKWTTKDLAQMFAEGKLAMLQGDFATSGIIYKLNPNLRAKTKVIPFPGEVKYSGRSSAFCLYRKSKVPEEAFECLQYLTIRPSLLKLFETARKFPARRWLYRGTIVEKDKDGGVFGKASHYAASQRMPPEWPEIAEAIVETLQEAFNSKTTPEKAIKSLHKKVKKIL